MLSLDLCQILSSQIPFFVRQKVQISSKINIFVTTASFVISSVFRQKRNPLEPTHYISEYSVLKCRYNSRITSLLLTSLQNMCGTEIDGLTLPPSWCGLKLNLLFKKISDINIIIIIIV